MGHFWPADCNHRLTNQQLVSIIKISTLNAGATTRPPICLPPSCFCKLCLLFLTLHSLVKDRDSLRTSTQFRHSRLSSEQGSICGCSWFSYSWLFNRLDCFCWHQNAHSFHSNSRIGVPRLRAFSLSFWFLCHRPWSIWAFATSLATSSNHCCPMCLATALSSLCSHLVSLLPLSNLCSKWLTLNTIPWSHYYFRYSNCYHFWWRQETAWTVLWSSGITWFMIET